LFLDQLGLVRSQLDAYVAQVVMGVELSRGEILFAGEGRRAQDLAAWSDDDICDEILRKAGDLKLADESPRVDRTRHRGKVYPPGAKGTSRTFNAMDHAVSMDGPLFLGKIGDLFAPNPMETRTVLHAAIIEACTREDFERLSRKVGLCREQARFTARVVSGRAVWSDDPTAAKAIQKKQSAIVQAMKEDRVFGYPF